MKTIILPTDFSPVATNAVHYGLDMALQIGASVLLLNVYQIPVSMTTDVPVVMVSAEELRKSSEQQLADLKSSLEHISSGRVKIYTESRLGNTVDELEDLCSKIRPFAVVMGTRGATGIERILFGSTTLTAIRHLTWPVIVIPPGKTFAGGIHKVGFACDFREVIETTPTQLIIEFVREFKAELHVLNVDYENRHFRAETPEESLLLHTMLEELHPTYDFIEDPDIESGINRFAEKNNLDLILMIPKKHKLLDGLFRKSATRQVVIQSHVPILCIHG
ncbi:MAG TPA: universal stress protein [Chitinophagaceae bacterium]|nr:universal stress protein [Chitinophagaceae bacterium]